MTQEEWKALLVEYSLAGELPTGAAKRIILGTGPCPKCEQMLATVPVVRLSPDHPAKQYRIDDNRSEMRLTCMCGYMVAGL